MFMSSAIDSLPDESRRVEMRVESHTSHISTVRKTVEQFAAAAGFGNAAAEQWGLCVNEALANVIRHAYGGQVGKPVVITLEYHPDSPSPAMQVTIRDWGNGVNPAKLKPKPYDPFEPGGVGLICLRSLMDDVTYTPQPDGMLMRMVKKKS